MENSAKVREYLRECGVFYIATEDARQPRVRPLNGIYLYEGKLCIFTPKDSPLYKRLKADPQMEICATHPDKSWISVIGRLNEDQRECVHEAVVKSYRDSIQEPEALLQCQMTVFRLDSARVKVTSVDGNVKECVL